MVAVFLAYEYHGEAESHHKANTQRCNRAILQSRRQICLNSHSTCEFRMEISIIYCINLKSGLERTFFLA